jgi:ribosomal-protein-alanine N-acetyltransferase
MSAAVTIRAAAPADLDAVVEIERRSFGDPWTRVLFFDALGGKHARFDVAVDAAGAVAGYIVAQIVADEGEVLNLAVAPGLRRTGTGALLLSGVMAEAEALGVGAVHLDVRESNTAARALYARFGFREVGRRRGYYRLPAEDALTLRRDFSLSPP